MIKQKHKTKIKITENIDYFEMLLDKRKDSYGNLFIDDDDLKKIKIAYDNAHDIRKFEISLYWQRTSFLWGFISLLIGGYGFLFVSFFTKNEPDLNKTIFSTLMLITSLIGLTFTGSWRSMLQSSKFWQENWELTIAILEKYITGNLHKIHFHRYKSPYIRYSIHKIMLSLLNRFYMMWFIFTIASSFIFLNDGFNFINLDIYPGKNIAQLVVCILALLYLLFDLGYRFIQFLLARKNKKIINWLCSRLEQLSCLLIRKFGIETTRAKPVTTDDVCIVYDDIQVEKEKRP